MQRGERRFRLGQQGEFEFLADGTLRQTTFAWPAQSPVLWRRMEEVRPTVAQLAAYAGTYHSEELGATYTVAVKDTTLVLKTRWAEEVIVRPTYADAFVGPFLVNFTRTGGATGRVNGMTFSGGRVRRVKFVKAG